MEPVTGWMSLMNRSFGQSHVFDQVTLEEVRPSNPEVTPLMDTGMSAMPCLGTGNLRAHRATVTLRGLSGP